LNGKIEGKRHWDPRLSTVEHVPNQLIVSHERPGIMATPHWHAQVEVNYVFRGHVEYRMQGHDLRLDSGQMAVFWGGLPHRLTDTDVDTLFIAIHLPLIHFFRLRLPGDMQQRLMRGATLRSDGADLAEDNLAFERWARYMRSGAEMQVNHAIEELLLRIERLRFATCDLIEPDGHSAAASDSEADIQGFQSVGRICDFITENFRDEIDCAAIALSADIHPKYAMSLFKKSTGMTLNEYVSLLRLSYAQSMLMRDEANVLRVAMDSGFGSLSAFNKCFRKIAGMSPSEFRRQTRRRQPAPAL
jgi:AraC-like DNA-binding protein